MKKQNHSFKLFLRVMAFLGAFLLFGMYIGTIVAALSNSPNFERLLMGSLATTFFVPTLIYGLIWLSKFFSNK